jgi:hypothetical protein
MSLLKIVRTNHGKIEKDAECRNYHCIANLLWDESELLKAIEIFSKKHKPNIGVINIMFYTSKWAAEVENYNDLLLPDYIRFCDEHTLCYLQGVFIENPLIDDLYLKCKSWTERDMTVQDVLDEMQMDSVKDDPEKLKAFIQYKNERDANKEKGNKNKE